MKKAEIVVLYIKYLSFIAFLVAGIVLYPAFIKYQLGKACLVMFLIYTVFTFYTFFLKNKIEAYSILNNTVICIFHFYICFVAYKYYTISDAVFTVSIEYFNLNFLIISICMLILTANKLILCNYK